MPQHVVERSRLEQELVPEELIKKAQAFAGLTEFDDNGAFIEPMTKLIEACIEEGDFSEEGLESFKADIQRILVNKLRMQDDITKHPEILEEDVSDPIIVVGVVRTGTTKLQRDLAADPGLRSIPFWEMLYPSRFPEEVENNTKIRRNHAAGIGGLEGHDTDTTQSAHAMGVDMVEEDMFLFESSFEHIYHYLRNKVPCYYQWLKGRSVKPAYASYKKIIQYLQWQDGGKDKTWMLKCTSHIGELETLFECFPNATVVHAHRDPCSSITSFSSVQEPSWAIRGYPGNKPFIGQAMLELWSDQIQRNLAARKRLGSSAKIVDIAYRDIRSDVLPVIERIYAAHGRELTAGAAGSIKAWGEQNQQHKWGVHQYDMTEFGLSKEMINEAFADYIEQFSELIY